MNPPEMPLTLTRYQAAVRQIEAAIAALEEGHFDLAITLAGAAEGMFESRKEGTLFHSLMNHPRAKERFKDKKSWISVLNLERDWLKHDGDDKSPAMQFELSSAAYMIARASSKITPWTPTIQAFRDWLLQNIDERKGRF